MGESRPFSFWETATKYERILQAVISEPWAIDPLKGQAIAEFLAFASSGRHYSETELAAKIGNAQARKIQERSGVASVIGIHGTMAQRVGMLSESSGGTSSDAVRAAVNAAVADDTIKAIVLHIDSPGGSIYGTAELAAAVRAAREVKPVIAQVDSLAASAAYWVASQATEIVATTGGEVGSIGVYTMHQDLSQALEAEGVSTTLVYAGERKVDGNPFGPLSDEAKAHLQGRVDAAYRAFVDAVASGRGVSAAAVRDGYGKGQTLSASDALAAGMIDRVATFDETMARYARSGESKDYSRRARAAAALAAI